MNQASENLNEILNKDEAKIYFVGIGGIAMSAAANLAKAFGFRVLGSDGRNVYPPAKNILVNNRIEYFSGYDKQNIQGAKADLYVLSAGEGLENPEVDYLLKEKLPRASFPEILYWLAQDNLRIVVAGTHGKSTTAGLLGHLVKNLDNSSFLVGGVLQNYESNFHHGNGHYFVFEGDEYKSQFDDPTPKFAYYKPDILVLTNLEYDHPDMFKNFQDLEKEFQLLIANMPEDGLIVYNADDPNLPRLAHESNIASASFGIENQADYQAVEINYSENYSTFEVNNRFSHNTMAKLLGKSEQYKIQLPGRLNVYNSLAAIATLRALGFSQGQLALNLLSFKGIKRRFEIVANKNGIVVIDDYAHHPTAVRETLQAARLKYPKARIWAVFEPHTFSRTKATLPDLALSFNQSDKILISEIYPARESAKDATITADEVVAVVKSKIKNPKSEIRKVKDQAEALDILKKQLLPGDVVVVMAVGSFNQLAYQLKETF